MAPKSKLSKDSSSTNMILLFGLLLVAAFLYNRYQTKQDKMSITNDYDAIRKYLLNDPLTDGILANTKKPILWIPVVYEYNARDWLSFGSRSSFDLNQPYLYLTVRSIIAQCSDSFHICLIDDKALSKLLPGWRIKMDKVSGSTIEYARQLGHARLLYEYGGLIVPPSFVCMRDLITLYQMAENNNKMIIAETVNRNITSTTSEFFPNMNFMGAPKGNETVKELVEFIERTMKKDYTAAAEFLGEFDRWCEYRVRKRQIIKIDGKLIGTKDMNNEMVLIDNLLTNDYIDFYSDAYGIYIPADEVLSRRHYEWFARMSQEQVLTGRVIICKYILLATAPDAKMGVIEPMKNKPDWVSFFRVPSGAPNWGLKGNYLMDNTERIPYPYN
jgi:hypothetical protein